MTATQTELAAFKPRQSQELTHAFLTAASAVAKLRDLAEERASASGTRLPHAVGRVSSGVSNDPLNRQIVGWARNKGQFIQDNWQALSTCSTERQVC
ncbi:MAG: hypothetical protein SFX18_15840 [Pirellulales bacterium]|nr:hypothetical protein [Pirellulales bacterium]